MAVRADVAADPEYQKTNYYVAQMTPYAAWTKYRPGVDVYPSVSIEIQTAVESVITGQKTAAQAAAVYAENVKKIVGTGNYSEK
jgi:multiple sugar transport system substrate-binding protein